MHFGVTGRLDPCGLALPYLADSPTPIILTRFLLPPPFLPIVPGPIIHDNVSSLVPHSCLGHTASIQLPPAPVPHGPTPPISGVSLQRVYSRQRVPLPSASGLKGVRL